MSGSGNLPPDLIKVVAERLDPKEFVILRAVYPSALAGEYNAQTRPPLLISFSDAESLFWSMSRVEEVYRAPLPIAPSLSGLGLLCYQGWMAIAQEGQLKLFNPISCIIIELPGSEKLCPVYKFALSSNPSVSDEYVIFVHVQPDTFAFYDPRKRAWTTETYRPKSQIMDLIHFKGRFVALDENRRVITFNPQDNFNIQENQVIPNVKGSTTPHLVECSGSLLVVWHKNDRFSWDSKTEFRVYKVDLDERASTEEKSLGSASVFLSSGCSFSVEFNAQSRLPEIRPNRIYCVDFFRHWDRKILSYNMEDRRIETHPELMPLVAGTVSTPRWIQPTF
ncbi:hypothetical protein ACJRO7_032507 [Eucalyptus globulus]|uniref:KIB1-4 beta-propeller domain-containing protein n=1 Tax=Eucalyptus globulus TaxID=34317 RepID=A0ABD3JN75_EUCGL